MGKPRKLPRKFSMPWGDGEVVDEVSIDTEHNEIVIQLLRYEDRAIGESLRFCQYWPDGRFQRQPMMLAARDIAAMRDAVKRSPRLHELLRSLV